VRDLFNEGIDIPETNMLVFMRYTGSYTVWLQQLGRGLRKTKPQGQEEFVYILDFVSSFERLNEIETLAKDINDERNKQSSDYNKVNNLSIDIVTTNDDKNKYSVHFSQAISTSLVDTLEKLKRRLGEEIRSTSDEGEGIPSMEDTLIIINQLTSNQELISQIKNENTRYGLIKEIFDSSEIVKEEQQMTSRCLDDAVTIYSRNNQTIPPSIFKDISNESEYDDLLNYSEHEVRHLLANKYLYGKKFRTEKEIECYAEIRHKKIELIGKYGYIISREDFSNKLSEFEQNEIKQVFKSKTLFLSHLEYQRNSAGV
jgi:hypothetical protein